MEFSPCKILCHNSMLVKKVTEMVAWPFPPILTKYNIGVLIFFPICKLYSMHIQQLF